MVAVGDNAMPVADVIAAHDAHSTLLLVSDRTRRVAAKLITTLSGARRLYVQPVANPYDAASVQQELRDSGVRTQRGTWRPRPCTSSVAGSRTPQRDTATASHPEETESG